MDEQLKGIDRLALFFIIYTLIFVLFVGTLSYTLPFVLAFVFAFILQKPTRFLINKLKISNSIAALVTTLVFFALIVSLLSWGVASISSEAVQFGKNTTEYIYNNTSKFNDYANILQKFYHDLDPSISKTIENNLSGYVAKVGNKAVDMSRQVVTSLVGVLASVPYLIMVILFTLLATYFFTKDMSHAKDKMLNFLPGTKSDRFSYIFGESKKMMSNYMLSYLLIIFITFVETLVVFIIFRIKYAVMLSVVCAFFDIMPILGIGAIYLPLIIIYFIYKNYTVAIGLIISYAAVSIIRQIIEPKIVSSSLGIHPVAVLAALFIGLKANGLVGMIYCIFLVVFYNIFKKVNVI